MDATLRRSAALGVALLLLTGGSALGQVGLGTITGKVLDPDGAPLPGVTVTVESPALMGTRTAITDRDGMYRLVALPPGMYTLTAALTGFKTFQRGNIEMRAGATFRVDMQLQLGAVEEQITVTAETPMLDIEKPGQALNISGEFQRRVPIQTRDNWSDFLELTPGIHARNFDDGSGRMVYFGHATEHFHHVIQVEGQLAGGYRDSQATYTQLSTEAIADTEVQTTGVEASAPMGNGLIINVVTKSGGNQFSGSLSYSLQPLDWNSNNAIGGPAGLGTPTSHKINQADATLGGPIVRDKAWFFTAFRWARNRSGISRTQDEIERLKAFRPGMELFNNIYEGFFPYAKVTTQFAEGHQAYGYYMYDVTEVSSNREYHFDPIRRARTGGTVAGGKLMSVWGDTVTSEFTVAYNNKTSTYSDPEQFLALGFSGPQIVVHKGVFQTAGIVRGTGRILEGGNEDFVTIGPSRIVQFRGDVSWYKRDWAGSHDFQFGFLAQPWNRTETTEFFLNDGFILEEVRLVDPNDPGSGTVPFHRRFASPLTNSRVDAEDRDIGVYLQDTWHPTDRLNISLGIRADFIKRVDARWDPKLVRMEDVAVGPRVGFTYMLTDNDIVRGSYARVHEQMNGRDSATSVTARGRVGFRDLYDVDGDGVFETEIVTPPVGAALAELQVDPDLHQPRIDEFVVGYRRQLPAEIVVDAAVVHRQVHDRYDRVDINGFYPAGPFQPFGGFGKVDPNRGRFLQLTNASWEDLVYTAVELTVTKRLSNNWQFMLSAHRQWQELQGTWNPTDPARFIQPDAYKNTKCIWQPRGTWYGYNSYFVFVTYCPSWRNYSVRAAATYFGPWGLTISGAYTHQAGPWSGPIFTRLDKPDPRFGPPKVVSSTGAVQSNPLATTIRFKFTPRDEGQVKAPDIKRLNLRIGKIFELGRLGRELEVALNIHNVLNLGDFQQYNYSGASQFWNPNYLKMRNRQAPRAFQIRATFRF